MNASCTHIARAFHHETSWFLRWEREREFLSPSHPYFTADSFSNISWHWRLLIRSTDYPTEKRGEGRGRNMLSHRKVLPRTADKYNFLLCFFWSVFFLFVRTAFMACTSPSLIWDTLNTLPRWWRSNMCDEEREREGKLPILSHFWLHKHSLGNIACLKGRESE